MKDILAAKAKDGAAPPEPEGVMVYSVRHGGLRGPQPLVTVDTL